MPYSSFSDLVQAATGHGPYPYQQRLSDEGLPDLLRVPTGTGKTLAATLPWLYRRRFHRDPDVRRETPRRLVIVLPQRSLVEQTSQAVAGWLDNLGLTGDVGHHTLMGGLTRRDEVWQRAAAQDAVLVGTQDMVLSRLLMRGYAENRSTWPISFGLLHADTQFVFDEIQLMGPALPTSLQLEGLRQALGAAAPCRSMWMSATVDQNRLNAPDHPGVSTVIEISGSDLDAGLHKRLTAVRRIGHLETDPKRYAASLASQVLERHRSGTRTIVLLNTVDRAGQVYDALQRARDGRRVVLLHSRFRPGDRMERMSEALAEPGPEGTILVATQVLEAGMDLDSHVLVTETAPWSSIVQRAGRCNRAGAATDAELLWTDPPTGRGSAAPYDEQDLAASREALDRLTGAAVTSTDLQEHPVTESRPLHAVLRRRDLIDLFDTSPDLSGNDIDVSRWVRDADSTTAFVAWRDHGKAGPPKDAGQPGRDELCPAPLGELRERLKDLRPLAWIFDQTTTEWRKAGPDDARPGSVIVLESSSGGYTPTRGWAPASTAAVDPVAAPGAGEADGLDSDALTTAGRWVLLTDHLEDVRREVDGLLSAYGDLPSLSAAQREAAACAGLYHDLGKVHEVFATSLRRIGEPPGPGPWAKSSRRGQLRHSRKAFRHELVSALMVLDPASGLLDGVSEPDLVAYLVAAHHGKVRLAARSAPGELADRLLGVDPADATGPVMLPGGRTVPALTLRREIFALGAGENGDSWQARACRLRDRPDLGPFRLAFLEAVVRLADWTASASYDEAS